MTGPTFRREGPLLEISLGVWVNVALVVTVAPALNSRAGVNLHTSTGQWHAPGEPATVARAVADAALDWAREQGQAEEEGRLMALDAQRIPPGEDEQGPPGGLITGLGWDESPWG